MSQVGGVVPYKILSCTSEDPSLRATNIYTPFEQGNAHWETADKTVKAELRLALSTPATIRTVVLENHGAAFIEVLCGNSSDANLEDNFQSLLPVHCLRSIQDVKNKQKLHETEHIRIKNSQMADKKFDRIRVVVRHYQPTKFGLRSLQLSSTRFTQRASPSPVSPAPTPAKESKGNIDIDDWEDFSDSESVVEPAEESKRIPKPESKPEKSTASTPPVAAPKKEEPKEAKEAKPPKPSKSAKPSKPMKGVVIVISGIGNPERSEIRDKAIALGAAYSATWKKNATHLICAKWNQQKCQEAKSARKPIVLPEWIHDSHEEGDRLEEDEYILLEPRASRSGRPKRSSSPRKVNYREDSDSFDDLDDGSNDEKSADDEWDPQKKTTQSMEEDESWGITPPKGKSQPKPSGSKKQADASEDFEMDEADGEQDDVDMEEFLNEAEEESKPADEDDADSEATEEMDPDAIKRAMGEQEDQKMENAEEDHDSISTIPPQPSKSEPTEDSEDVENQVITRAPGKHGPLQSLPDFLASVKCAIHVEDRTLAHKIQKYIVAYGGSADRFLFTDSTHLVTDKEWQPSFSRALDTITSLQIIHPSWVEECHDKQTMVDAHDFLVPDD